MTKLRMYPTTNNFSALFVAFVIVLCLCTIDVSNSSNEPDANAMDDELRKLARSALGKNEMQRLVDDKATWSSINILHMSDQGKHFAEKLAAKLSSKLKERADAVTRIKEVVEEEYANFPRNETYQDGYDECCAINSDVLDDNKFLGRKVDTSGVCYRVSAQSTGNYILPVNDKVYQVMHENYGAANHRLAWQYFGSEDGTHVTFPSRVSAACDNYDPRFRPWYVETATPVPKDIVLVIDKSSSMNKSGHMQIAKEAAKTVIETLNPNDRIGVVKFDETASTAPGSSSINCYNHELAYAIKANVEYLKGYIDSLAPQGSAIYSSALEPAFNLLQKTQDPYDGQIRDKAILFLTDASSDVSEAEKMLILEEIAARNAKLNNSVVIMTYAIGEDTHLAKAEELLKNMADQTLSNSSFGEVKPGSYSKVTSLDHLRLQLGSYYNQFSRSGDLEHARATVPYVDHSGLGLVTSLCEPVHHNDTLVGVACIDVRMADILFDIAYYQHGEYAYSFIIDGTGRTFLHPLLPNPLISATDKNFLDIGDLEREPGTDEILESMKSGGSGSKSLDTVFYQGNGNVTKQGVTATKMLAVYQWQHIAGTNFSLCLVFSEQDKQVNITVDYVAENFLYYRFDLRMPKQQCNNLANIATTELSSVKLTSHAFEDSALASYATFQKGDLKDLENLMTLKHHNWPGRIKEGIIDVVAVTSKMDEHWKKSNEEFGKYVIWRYLGTYNGVFRKYPGSAVPHAYDHLDRPWYDETIANKDRITVTVPYLDAFGAGYVVTIAHTIKEEKSSNVFGVIGMDIKLDYIGGLLDEGCPERDQVCFLLDNAGFVIYHPDFKKPDAVFENVHVSKKEPDVARYLIDNDHMTAIACVSLEDKHIYNTWKLVVDENIEADSFFLKPISDTNLYIVLKTQKASGEECSCNGMDVSACEGGKFDDCQCPCYTHATNYDYCKNTFENGGVSTCLAPKPPTNSSSFLKNEAQIAMGLPPCFDGKCQENSEESECTKVHQCSWCRSTGKCQQYDDECQETTTVKGTPPTTQKPATNIIIGGAAGGAVVFIMIISIVTFCCIRSCRRDTPVTPPGLVEMDDHYDHPHHPDHPNAVHVHTPAKPVSPSSPASPPQAPPLRYEVAPGLSPDQGAHPAPHSRGRSRKQRQGLNVDHFNGNNQAQNDGENLPYPPPRARNNPIEDDYIHPPPVGAQRERIYVNNVTVHQ